MKNFNIERRGDIENISSVRQSNVVVLLKQDDNRYNASRGAHLNLKRAERARILVNKIPGMDGVIERDSYETFNPMLWLFDSGSKALLHFFEL